MTTATQINLADRASIREQLEAARAIYEARNAQLKDLYQEVEHLRAIVEHMAALAGERLEPVEPNANANSAKRSASPAQDETVAIVLKHRRPMKAAEVARELGKESNAVGAALWAAANNRRLRKTGPGLYAPPDYIPPPDTLLAPQDRDGADRK